MGSGEKKGRRAVNLARLRLARAILWVFAGENPHLARPGGHLLATLRSLGDLVDTFNGNPPELRPDDDIEGAAASLAECDPETVLASVQEHLVEILESVLPAGTVEEGDDDDGAGAYLIPGAGRVLGMIRAGRGKADPAAMLAEVEGWLAATVEGDRGGREGRWQF